MTGAAPSTAAAPALLHLIDTGGPGGAETVFAELASRIPAGQAQVLPVVPREDWLSARLRSLGLTPVILEARGSLNLSYARALLRIARVHRVRLIHTHLLGSAVYGAVIGLALRVPVIAVFHGPTDLRAPGKLAFVKRWLISRRCAAVIAVSSSTYEALTAFGVPASRITLIRNGVDTERFSPGQADELRSELKLTSEDLLIGAVGNIRSPKAYDVLLKAAALVLERQPRAFFAVLGQGDEKAMAPLLRLRAALGIEPRFQFLGFHQSSAALYRNLDVFVSSSRSEGLSLSFLEAMASGRAIVATLSGGAQEAVVAHESGLLVPTEDPAQLAEALLTVLEDAALRARLGGAARERAVREFSLKATLKKYAALYERLMGPASS